MLSFQNNAFVGNLVEFRAIKVLEVNVTYLNFRRKAMKTQEAISTLVFIMQKN